jgi:uncharacterized Zn finger protein
MQPHSVSESPEPDRQSCPHCRGLRVQAVMMTSMVVYLRCEDCGEVWNIPQRRRARRFKVVRDS